MIYTITFNPALDYFVTVQDFSLGKTNRTSTEHMLAGGKGINVSTVLKNLGLGTTALGFVAGFTGEEIVKRVQALGISTDFVKLPEGVSRINVKLLGSEGTEINGMGPVITEDALSQLLCQLGKLQAGDILVLAGSIPAGLPTDIYKQILHNLADKEVKVVVDAAGQLLLNTLSYHPFLIKPNRDELGEIFDVKIEDRAMAITYAQKLRQMGAKNVLVSLAGEGAVLVDENGQEYESPAPKGTLVNGVGAGDSMVAGFLAGYIEGREKQEEKSNTTNVYLEAFYTAVAAGSASAFSKQLATREQVEALRDVFPIE
ncbi:MAG: 1-phosphofructokinase [Lachnospiraceae bacterium]|nr:1-phosphofructokinase [Lachnospiraceae bacterium]